MTTLEVGDDQQQHIDGIRDMQVQTPHQQGIARVDESLEIDALMQDDQMQLVEPFGQVEKGLEANRDQF